MVQYFTFLVQSAVLGFAIGVTVERPIPLRIGLSVFIFGVWVSTLVFFISRLNG